MAVRVQAVQRLFPGLWGPRKPQRQPSPHQQSQPAPPQQRPRGGPKSPLQNALAGPLSLLSQGAAAPASQAAAEADAGAEPRCEVANPSDPVRASRREMMKTIDMLLLGLGVLLLCTCCPLGLVFSLVLSLGGLLLQLAAMFQPEVLVQLAGSVGATLDASSLWSLLAGLDATHFFMPVLLAFKKLLLLGLDVYSLLAGLVVGALKLGAALVVGVGKLGALLVLGVGKIAKALVLAGADVWSILVGGAVGVSKGTRAAWGAWTGRRRDGEGDGAGAGQGGGSSAGGAPAPPGTPSAA